MPSQHVQTSDDLDWSSKVGGGMTLASKDLSKLGQVVERQKS